MAYNGFKNAKCDEWKQTCKQTCQAETLHTRQAGGGVGKKAARSKHESTQSGSIEPQHLQICGGAWRVSCGCAVPVCGPNEVALGRSGEVVALRSASRPNPKLVVPPAGEPPADIPAPVALAAASAPAPCPAW